MSGTGYGTPAPPGPPQGYSTPAPPSFPPGAPNGGTPPTRSAAAGRGDRRRTSQGPGLGTGLGTITVPPRRVIVGSLVGALMSGAMLGLVLGVIAPVKPPEARVIPASIAGAPTLSGTAAPTSAQSRPSATPTSATTRSAKIKTVTRTEVGPPTGHIDRPQGLLGMKLMIMEDVWNEGDGLVLRGPSARLLSGRKAKEYYESKGEEVKPFAVEPSGETIEVRVRGDALLFGERYIGFSDQQERKQFAKEEFRERGRAAIDNGKRPVVWYKRGFGDDKAVYVAEQYLG
ncbi:MAG: hypothetical protein QG622_1140 [Actinomycetota bacterium]|nr:hypothetical protein [Actinomycetota bacterium]